MTEEYIETEGLPEPYRRVADNINRSFATGHYVCTALLLRSMLEILVTDILLRNPGPAAVWEDSKKGMRYGLHRLLTTLWDFTSSDYKPYLAGYSGEPLDTLKDASWEIKKLGDSCAHEIMPNEIERRVTEHKINLGNLVIFLTHLHSRIPEGRKILSDDKREETDKLLRYEVEYPHELPSHHYWLKHPNEMPYFDVIFRVQPPPKETTCWIEIESHSQTIGFLLETPVKRMNWHTLRREEHIMTLSYVISDRLKLTHPTEYVFHAVLRPNRLHALQKPVTLKYRIYGQEVEGHRFFDSGHARLVLPLVDDLPSKSQQSWAEQ